MFRTLTFVKALLLASSIAYAQEKLKVIVSSEFVPTAGGTAQIKVFLTTPRAISSGNLRLDVRRTSGEPAPFASAVSAATVFSATGDAFAASDSDSGFGFGISFSSATAGVGRVAGLPIAVFSYQTTEPVTVTLATPRSKLVSGGKTFDLDVQAGAAVFAPPGYAVITVGRVTYPLSASGVVPAGSSIQIDGTAFTDATRADIEGTITTVNSVTSNSISLRLLAPTMLRGRRLRVSQPDANTVFHWFGMDSGTFTFAGPAASAIDCAPGGLSLADPNRWIIHNPNSSQATVTITNAYDPSDRSPSVRPTTFTATIPAGGMFATATTDPPSTTVRTSPGTPVRAICAAFQQQGGPLLRAFSPTYPDSVPAAPSPVAIVSAATAELGPIAPGQIVSVFGAGLGPDAPVGPALTPEGDVATERGGVRVRLNGIPSPLLYASTNQVNFVVPYEIPASSSANLEVEFEGRTSPPQGVMTVPARPGIFTLNGSGQGQAAVLNQDGTANGPGNPAPGGSVIQIFATGEGVMAPSARTGSVTSTSNTPVPLQPIRVVIAGVRAQVDYAGAAPQAVAGMLQVNAVVPPGLPAGDAVPLRIFAGNAESPAVTVAVRP